MGPTSRLGTGYLTWLASRGSRHRPVGLRDRHHRRGDRQRQDPQQAPGPVRGRQQLRAHPRWPTTRTTRPTRQECQARLRRPRHHQRLDRRRLQLAHRQYLRGLRRLQLWPRGRTPGATGGVEDLPLLDRHLQPPGLAHQPDIQAYAGGARISSNSWGGGGHGGYNSDSQEYDALVRDAQPGVSGNQQMVEVFAAGNAGGSPETVSPPATGKNVIAVGATEGVARQRDRRLRCGNGEADQADDVVGFSGRGPTTDGRLKPDLVAPAPTSPAPRPRATSTRAAGCATSASPPGTSGTRFLGDLALHAGGGGRGGAAARPLTGARRARCPRRR